MTGRPPAARTGPFLAALVMCVISLGAVLQLGLDGEAAAELTPGDHVAPLTLALFTVVAGVVTARRPDLAIGWHLLGFAALMSVTGASQGVTSRAGDRPWTGVADWLQSWTWLAGVAFLGLALLHFPDGRLPTGRWRPVAWLHLLAVGVALVLAGLQWPERASVPPGVVAAATGPADALVGLGLVLTSSGVGLSLVSLFVRWRNGGLVVRQQLTWLLLPAVFLLVSIVGSWVVDVTGVAAWWQDALGAVGLLLIPVSIGAGILRYRLFEIDRLVSRTVSWAVVSVVLAGIYLGGVVVLQTALQPLLGEGDLPVALATLVAAAVARPLLVRVRAMVDQRFNRARYDAARTVEAFGRRAREEVGLDQIVADLRGAVCATVQPAGLAVHLVVPTRTTGRQP